MILNKNSFKYISFKYCSIIFYFQNGKPVDFSTIPADELNVLLGKFYAEATPKSSDKRNRKMTAAQAK